MVKIIKLSNLLLPIGKIPIVRKNTILKETLDKMNKSGLGFACIVDKNFKLQGIFTDGDLRRKIINIQKPWAALLSDDTIKYSTNKPLTIKVNSNLNTALNLMKKKKITDLPVIKNNKLIGILHLNSIIKFFIKNK